MNENGGESQYNVEERNKILVRVGFGFCENKFLIWIPIATK